MAEAIMMKKPGGGGGKLKYATGTITGKNSRLTINHNLGTKKVLVFWIAEANSKIDWYTQMFGAYLFPEAYTDLGYVSQRNKLPLNYIGEDQNQQVGWFGAFTDTSGNNNVNVSSRNDKQFYYGAYNDGGFVNDGNTVSINVKNRTLYNLATYRWIVLAVDWEE